MARLVVFVLHRGRALGLGPNGKFTLMRSPEAFVLASQPAGCTLLHLRSALFCCVDGRAVVARPSQPTLFELYSDPERSVVLRGPGGDFLQAGSGDEVRASSTPLRRDRGAKLWQLVEVGVPARALAPWPLRVNLQTEQGAFVSVCGGKLPPTAEVPCCGEEVVLDLPGVSHRLVHGRPEAAGCAVWDATATRLVWRDPLTDQLTMVSQACATGAEGFTLQLSPGNQVSLLHELRRPGGGGSEALQLPVTCHAAGLECSPGGRPARFDLLPASGKPTLLLTAHGQLVAAQPNQGAAARIRGAHRPDAPAAPDSLRSCSWLLAHHGDRVYSLRQAAGGRQLCLDECGAPCLAASGQAQLGQQRGLFRMDLTWATLPAAPSGRAKAGGEAQSPLGVVPSGEAGREGGGGGSFVVPRAGEDLSVIGFSLRSLHKIHGRHLYLSAMPNGLITTVYSGGSSLTRAELFTLIDQQAVLGSPLAPLQALPRGPSEQASGMRRCSSMQAMSRQTDAQPSRPAPETSLRLPAIRECRTFSGPAPCSSGVQARESQPRRCHSEPSLSALGHAEAAPPPRWLASCNRSQAPGGLARPGWGVLSAAPLQELALRATCALVLGQCCPGWQHLPVEVTTPMLDCVRQLQLPEELSGRVVERLGAMLGEPGRTKVSVSSLIKLSSADSMPAWASTLVPRSEEDDVLAAHLAPEAYLCTCCQGASGLLLPLTARAHPQHHLFLEHAERRHRAAEGLRGRQHRGVADLPLMALQLGKQVLFFWGVAKCLAVVSAARRQ